MSNELLTRSVEVPTGLSAAQKLEISGLTVKELEQAIKKAWKEGNKDLSRHLHERKAQLKSMERQKSQQNSEKNTSSLSASPLATDATDTEMQPTLAVVERGHHHDSLIGSDSEDDTSDSHKSDMIEIIVAATESHKQWGDFVKSIIYGGLDGIITTFAVVAGVQGADLKPAVILVLGFANLVADGLSMGIGDYLSEKAEIDFASSERDREKWEFDCFRESEINEMIEIYETNHGISTEDATVIIETMAKYPDFFIDHMMIQELGLNPPDPDANPALNGLSTLIAFLCFGVVPLLSYLIFTPIKVNGSNPAFIISICLTISCLAFLGAFKAKLTETDYWQSIGFTVLNGSIAAGASWVIGFSLSQFTNLREHDN